MKKETACVHSGTYRDREVRGINTPIFTSSACEYLDREGTPYPRYFNTPNQEAVVRKLCALEGAEAGVLFSSGMAAMSTSILAFAGAGDHVVLMDELYGGTHAFATGDFGKMGIGCSFAPTNADAVCEAATDRTKVIVIESPTNPLLGVVDIARVARFARERGITTVIDNTFASPMNQNPLAFGIDVVVHSATKYLGGHSDLCCGVALTSKEKAQPITALARHLGGSLDTFACYLLERSIKTLALRVERQSANAMAIASFLQSHPAVRRVNYPGLPDFPGHEIARAQMKDFRGMLSFYLDENRVDPARFVRGLDLIVPAVSLGGVDTTICSPAVTSHATISREERERLGITDSLFRLSVGIEHMDDLIADLEQELKGQGRP
ncbi:MAG TPA: PLP-dependent aspartate aminotransferase family protein [Deltaproteobacteria bacterium]|nr:PLP-dependent aspartate aminotransferase family protein [Deltaproteobacteria bacterium]HOI05671.1 PLP-dependent aspartate aminotransferase family protein [Deltaproteobacteria bacterium]